MTITLKEFSDICKVTGSNLCFNLICLGEINDYPYLGFEFNSNGLIENIYGSKRDEFFWGDNPLFDLIYSKDMYEIKYYYLFNLINLDLLIQFNGIIKGFLLFFYCVIKFIFNTKFYG